MRSVAIIALLLASACSGPASHNASPAATFVVPTASPTRLSIAGLGDSVTAAWACGCGGFLVTYGHDLQARFHVPVTMHNLGVLGEGSAGLLVALQSDANTKTVVEQADIDVVTIGANDFSYNPACDEACYAPNLSSTRSNLSKIFATIAALRAGKPTRVLVTGYWEIWEDGAVGRRKGAAFMSTNDALTKQINAIINAEATSAGARYVDLYVPFRGVQGTTDDTALLARDGDHPNAAGHAVIARALLAATT